MRPSNIRTNFFIDNHLEVITKFLLAFFLACLIMSTSLISQATPAAEKVLIFHQQAEGYSQQLIELLAQNLKNSGYQPELLINDQALLNINQLQQQQLIISVGSITTQVLLDNKIDRPMLSLLIPKQTADAFRASYPESKNWSNLVIDQPLERHFHLISEILGKQIKTGVLLSSYTRELEPLLTQAAKKTRHELVKEYIENPEYLSRALKQLNNNVDILLTLPDPVIYNKNTIRGILLLSYRNKLPILGFSRAYVKAGAIAAVYSEPEQISNQAIGIVNEFFNQQSFSAKEYLPDDFSVSLNTKVAHSLGIDLPDSATIVKQMKKSEKKL